jgi:hypothetical protein
MVRFHPSILLVDIARAADCIGCQLVTDRRGHLVVMRLPEAQPINPERHSNINVVQIREYRNINLRAVPRAPGDVA